MMTEFPCVLINADNPVVFENKYSDGNRSRQSSFYGSDSQGCSLAQLYWQDTAFIHRLSDQVTMQDSV